MTPPERRRSLRIDATSQSGHVVLHMDGVLDTTTYRAVRDAIVKCALDEPASIVVDVSGLQVPSQSAWAVFTSARWLVGRWPNVPIALVCRHASGRRAITRNGIVRYLPLYGTLGAATAAMSDHDVPSRHRARQSWPASTSTVTAARSFVTHWLDEWSQSEFTATACVITTALVDNVLRHTLSDPDLRLESDGVTVTVAVTDGSHELAGIHEDDEMRRALTDLQIVASLTRVWGNTPLADGKVVWAVIGPENRL